MLSERNWVGYTVNDNFDTYVPLCKTLSILLIAVRSMAVTVNVYSKDVLPEATTLTSTIPSDSLTMYMSCSN